MTLNDHYQLWAIERQQSPLQTTARDAFLNEVSKTAKKIVWSRCAEYADDLAQEVTMQIWQRIDSFNPARSSIFNWVKLTTEAVLNRHLAGMYQQGIQAEVEIDDLDLSTYRYSSDDHSRLKQYFSSDPELLNLLLDGYSLADCQQQLGLTRKAVRHRLNKAQKRHTLNKMSSAGAI